MAYSGEYNKKSLENQWTAFFNEVNIAWFYNKHDEIVLPKYNLSFKTYPDEVLCFGEPFPVPHYYVFGDGAVLAATAGPDKNELWVYADESDDGGGSDAAWWEGLFWGDVIEPGIGPYIQGPIKTGRRYYCAMNDSVLHMIRADRDYAPMGEHPTIISSRRRARQDGFLYLLKAGEYYKIGRTTNPHNRVNQLSIQLPFEVEVLAMIPYADHVRWERWWHQACKEFRTNGEWFALPDTLVDLFCSFEMGEA